MQAYLPGGGMVTSDRGAGQGEPDGPLKTALVIGLICKRLRQQLGETAVADTWFMDDGQLYLKPHALSALIETMDKELRRVGATRGCLSGGDDIKSSVRFFSDRGAVAVDPNQFSARVRDTCRFHQPGDAVKVLGGWIADAPTVTSRFEDLWSKAEQLHEAVDLVDNAAVTYVLKSMCLGTCKAAYQLRLQGDMVSAEALRKFEDGLRGSLATTLGAELDAESWKQSTCAVNKGGLGFRTPEEVAVPAFVASRITARPAVDRVFSSLRQSGLAPAGWLETAYDDRLTPAQTALFNRCRTVVETAELQQTLALAAAAAAEKWAVMAGRPPPDPGHDLAEVAEEEHEEIDPKGIPKAPKLQRQICSIFDRQKMQELRQTLQEAGRYYDIARLGDLTAPAQDHRWITNLNEETGPVMAPVEWRTAVRLRQGCSLMAHARRCAGCGHDVLDTQCSHSLCCAMAESTRGHNELRNEIAAVMAAVDPATETEPVGLIPAAPQLRPADVLTRAAHGSRDTAIDIMVVAPHACSRAGGDATESGKADKLDKYADYIGALEDQGIRYAPAVVTCFGRRHPDLDKMLQVAADKYAGLRGLPNGKAVLKKWQTRVAVAVWKRAARMAHHCLWLPPGQWDDITAEHNDSDQAIPPWVRLAEQ